VFPDEPEHEMGDADRSTMLWPPRRMWTPQLAARLGRQAGPDDPETMEGQRNFVPPRDEACPDWPTRPYCFIGDRFVRMRGFHFSAVYEFIERRIQMQRDWLVRTPPSLCTPMRGRTALLLLCVRFCRHRIIPGRADATPHACPHLLLVRTTRTLCARAPWASSSAACTRPQRCHAWRGTRRSCACESSRHVRTHTRACLRACHHIHAYTHAAGALLPERACIIRAKLHRALIRLCVLCVSQVCVEDYEGYDVTAPEELAAHTRDIHTAEAELTRARQEEVRRGVA
jgi:hypothetical protein